MQQNTTSSYVDSLVVKLPHGQYSPHRRFIPKSVKAQHTQYTATFMIEGILRNSVVLVLIIHIASGCTSLRPLPDEKNALEQAVKPGDKVHVITHDGKEMEFTVTQIANERIEGSGQGVAIDDIAKIERREISILKTGVLEFGVTVIAIIQGSIYILIGLLAFGSV